MLISEAWTLVPSCSLSAHTSGAPRARGTCPKAWLVCGGLSLTLSLPQPGCLCKTISLKANASLERWEVCLDWGPLRPVPWVRSPSPRTEPTYPAS